MPIESDRDTVAVPEAIRERVAENARLRNELAARNADDAAGAHERFRDLVNCVDGIVWEADGMGLPISRSIIESHGGRLWATDHAGRGATFQFNRPAAAAAQV